MYLKEPIVNLFAQLSELLKALTDDQFIKQIPIMSSATIGQHMRHIIEFYLALDQGYISGEVNYDQRKRDHAIETDRYFAIAKLQQIAASIEKPNHQLLLAANYTIANNDEFTVPSSYYRELVYNLEHTVHHMALIRIAVAEFSSISLPIDFGLAISTLKYRNECAQ
ncbi:hypothetical protein [Pedobacter sp. Hv1]|uniref:hypothetical protein n=1 Tax=Pedobacter sp. Hv1 TaxID=1740090 RepID=UPI0006D8CF05|nr:hypothetical protein [Pedobacter sp. Hv1]KQC00725.1 hypothetical protein AQF98_08580 [Pedobacter sp. Hv1]